MLSIALFLNLQSFIPAKAAYQTSGLIADWIGSTLTNNSSAWTESVSGSSLTQSNTSYYSQNGGYLTLNGTTSFLRSPSNLATFSTNNMSMFFWIFPTSNNGMIVQMGRNNPSDSDTEMFFQLASGKLSFWDYDGGVGFSDVASSGSVNLNAWNYVGFTKSTSVSTSTLNFYINGSASGSYTAANKTISLNDFVIGKDYRDNNKFYTGSISRATVWSATLSGSEVSNNYAATNGIAIAPSITTSNNSQTGLVGSAITTATTSNTGGAVSTYSVSPSLPLGITMDTAGNISGTPTSPQSSTSYTITATNPAGTSTSTFTLVVLTNSTTASFTNIPLAYYRQPTSIVVTVTGASGKVTFKHEGKNIVGCIKVSTVTSSTITATCSWKPSVKKYVLLTATFVPTSAAYTSSTTPAMRTLVIARSNTR